MKDKKKKKYNSPKIQTEKLLVFGQGGGGGGTCNGSATGGRKSTDVAPDFCTAGKLKT